MFSGEYRKATAGCNGLNTTYCPNLANEFFYKLIFTILKVMWSNNKDINFGFVRCLSGFAYILSEFVDLNFRGCRDINLHHPWETKF